MNRLFAGMLTVLLLMSGSVASPEEHASTQARITIRAGEELFRLSELMIGANMEDLHYQMTGGISSQLIHGECFFEPSPTQLAPFIARVAGFANCGGDVNLDGGELWMSGKGTRLTSEWPSQACETRVEMKLLTNGTTAGLAMCVSPLNADDRWEWYSGYTALINSKAKQVVLRKAARANQHWTLAMAPMTDPAETWLTLALRVEGSVITVLVNGQPMIQAQDNQRLAPAHCALVAQGSAGFRGLHQKFRDDRRAAITLETNPLLAKPGDAISLRWTRVQRGSAQGRFALDTEGTWFPNSSSQTVEFIDGEGEVGIDNAGLKRWGIALHQSKPYEGFIRVKTTRPTEVCVSLRGSDGNSVYAEKTLTTRGETGDYERIGFTLTPCASDAQGRFAITLKRPGAITLGYVFMQPGEWGRYKGLPVRKDLAEALVTQGIRVLRINGGMIERPGYRWANMQGLRDRRPPYDGFYDRYCSNGFGVIEAVQFAEAAGLTIVPALNLDETPESIADFIAYCNVPQDTPTGRRRAADGHPAPYGIRYFQFANESPLNAAYVEKFKKVAEAVWAIDPGITLLPVGKTYTFKPTDTAQAIRKRLKDHLELTRFVKERGHKLLWDCHAFNTSDNPAQCLGGQIPGAIEFSRWLTKLDPSLGIVPIGTLEFNAGRFDYGRGLAHALEMNVTHRAGDIVRAVGMPNVSQPWGVYQTDWKAVLWTQGNIYYTPEKVWYQPAAYVDQMIARHWAPRVVKSEVQAPEKTLNALAARTADGEGLVLRVVNLGSEPVKAAIALHGFTPARPVADIEELTGALADFNTLEAPEKIKPAMREWKHGNNAGEMAYTFPGHSFTIIELRCMKTQKERP